MGPLPKRKISKSRRNKRRSHDALTLKHLVQCASCGKYHVAHHVCPKCGAYKGEQVLEIKTE